MVSSPSCSVCFLCNCVRCTQEIIIRRQRNTSQKKKILSKSGFSKDVLLCLYSAFLAQQSCHSLILMLVILIQTHVIVLKKREELILCRSQSFSLFSLWFVPLLWGSVALWHLQVTVAVTGCNTYLSLSAEKNLAMIYLELFTAGDDPGFPFLPYHPPSHGTK